jgi:T5SS/PEP-CTERM-associated repeat protein
VLGVAVFAMALPGLAQAQMRWDGSTSSDWTDGSNWDTGLVPTGGSAPVVSGPAPRMPVLTGGTTSLTTLYVGYDNASGGAGLTITGGASLTTSSASVGEQSNNNAGDARETESGTVTLNGASSWTSAFLQIGAYGTGTIDVSAASTLTATTSLSLGEHNNSVTNRSGNGTLTISGTGSQVISDGTTVIGSNGSGTVSITGGGKITTKSTTLGNGATASGTVTVSGTGSRWETTSGTLVIGNGGSGQFTVSGSATAKTSTIYLAGQANSSGTLTVTDSGSRLEAGQIRAGVASTGSITVKDGGELQTTQLLLGATTTGKGEIDLRGSGSLVNASGYTMIGWLGEGSVTVAEGATLRGTVRIAFDASSKGTLNIGAAEGSAAAAAGTVDAATAIFGNGNGTIVFNHTDTDYKFAAEIQGSGTLKQISGTTLLTGNSTSFSGTTTISGGTLLVGDNTGGTLGGTVSVQSGGTLGGSGTVGTTTVASGGTISPGNSVGTLTVNGNATFASGSTYRVEIAGASADLLTISGTASLAGTIQLVAGGGSYSFNAPYTVLTAGGGRTGTFGTVTTIGSFGLGVTSEVSYDSNNVRVTLKAGSLVEAGSGPAYITTSGLPLNSWSIAAAIDRAVANGADPSFLYQVYARNDREALIGALATLTGEVHATTGALGLAASGGFLTAALDPFAAGRDPNAMPGAMTGSARAFSTAGSYASSGSATELPSAKGARIAPEFMPDRRYNVWGQIFGSKSRSDGSFAQGTAASDSSSGHVALGVDLHVVPGTVIGAAIAAGEARSTLSGNLGDAKADILQAGLYGMTRIGALSLGAALGYASADTETSRAIPLVAAFAVKGKYRSDIWSGRAEAAYRLFEAGGVALSPYGAFTTQHVRTPGFSERDAVTGTPTGLAVAGRSGTTARTELGLRLDAAATLFDLPAAAFGKLGWGYYAKRDNQFSASLIGLPGSAFTFQGTRPDRNAALVSTGLDIKITPAVSLGARFDGEFSQNNQSYAGAATLKVSF